jgi:hypothetical protein
MALAPPVHLVGHQLVVVPVTEAAVRLLGLQQVVAAAVHLCRG